MICVYKIYEFIFSIIILFYYCFSGTPPVECNLLCMTLLRIYVQIPPQPEQKFQVSLSPQVPVGEKKKDTEGLENQRRIDDVLLCLPDRHQSIKHIPSSIFSFLLQKLFLLYLAFFPVFEISSYVGSLVISSSHRRQFSSFLSFVPLQTVYFSN